MGFMGVFKVRGTVEMTLKFRATYENSSFINIVTRNADFKACLTVYVHIPYRKSSAFFIFLTKSGPFFGNLSNLCF